MRNGLRGRRTTAVGFGHGLARADQIPSDFPDRDRVTAADPGDDNWIEPGNSVICNPSGEVVAGPLRHEEGILLAEVSLSKVYEARRMFDPTGHYNRPDVFQLTVDARERRTVVPRAGDSQ